MSEADRKKWHGTMTRAPEGTRAMEVVTLRGPLGAQLRRTRFDGGQQRLVGQMAVARRALVIGMPENFPDREQVDAGVDHKGRRAVPQVMQVKVA